MSIWTFKVVLHLGLIWYWHRSCQLVEGGNDMPRISWSIEHEHFNLRNNLTWNDGFVYLSRRLSRDSLPYVVFTQSILVFIKLQFKTHVSIDWCIDFNRLGIYLLRNCRLNNCIVNEMASSLEIIWHFKFITNNFVYSLSIE